MPAVQAPAKVLVTGASGFIALWIVRTLLERSFTVVGTVRSRAKGEYVKKKLGQYGDKFEYVVVEDIGTDDAFDEAVRGVDAIMHTASPVNFTTDDPSEFIDPAVNGTVNILKSAAKNGRQVKRIIVTSSMAAIQNMPQSLRVWTEADWNEHDPRAVREKGRDARPGQKYCASKTLAEQAAWRFVKANKGKIGFDLAVINPPWVFGPFIHEQASLDKLNPSLSYFRKSTFDQHSADTLAEVAGSWVDVRDVALAHVLALEKEEAGGERFLTSAGPWSRQEIYALHEAPDFVPTAAKGVPGAGSKKERGYGSGEKTQKVLGIQFRSLKETARDTVASLREGGWAEGS